jgi:tetratricopeptide (TPR) repeat protein
MRRSRSSGALLLAALAVSSAAAAQDPPVVLPDQSPRARVSQTVGLTQISIDYGRPGVNGRKIWGGLVPYDSVWRAGANVNTVIAFSSPVTIQGKELPAGRYGVHLIPTARQWTVILSRQASAWGSFSYDPAEDALRVTVTPRQADFHERLAYTLDDPTESTVVATLRWEKLAVPVPIQVNTKAIVIDSLRQQLRGLGRFFWQPWNQAAAWALANDVNLDEALTWTDRSMAINENFTNLRTKAAILDKKGNRAAGDSLRRQSLEVATEADMNTYGYQLLGQRKLDEAIEVFRKNVKGYPRSWNTYDSLGEAYALKGDKRQAIANYSKALAMVRDPDNKRRIQGVIKQLSTAPPAAP